MMFSKNFATFAAVACVSLAVIPVVRSAVIDVTVGGTGILAFNPQFVNANVGDKIQFTFKQKNHTATQSTLANPCAPADGGFDSGFIPVADSVTDDFPLALLTIKDTNPIWVYCRQATHCQQGMVFAVNPGDKFAQFQAAATAGSSSVSASVSSASSTATTAAAATAVVTVTATVTVSSGQTVTTTYASYPGSAAPTSASSQDHSVIVGGTGGLLTYSPSNITAQPGDTVTFEFHQKNHTVTASSFAQPCRALSLTSTTGQVGFDSGFMPVADNATTFPTYTIQINDTNPIWAYCRQATHCGQGMVFSVNAVEAGPNNFEAFQAKAIQLNGTSTTSSTATSSSSTSTSSSNAALGVTVAGTHGAGIVMAVVGVVVGSLL